MKIFISFLYILFTIITLAVLYKMLIRRLGRKSIKPELYCELVSIEHQPAGGIIDFCFFCNSAKHIHFDITDLNFNPIEEITSKEYKAGQHILKFDSTHIDDGFYFYRLRTDNQQIFKKIHIKNN